MPGWLIVLFLLGALAGVKVWLGSVRHLPPVEPSDAMMCRYGMPDWIFAGFLGAFFLLMIAGAGSETPPVTREALLQGMAFYVSLVTAIFSFVLLRGLSPGEIWGLGRERIPLQALGGPQEDTATGSATASWDGDDASRPSKRAKAEILREKTTAGWLADAGRGLLLFSAAYPLLMLTQMGVYTLLQDQAQSQDILRFLVEKSAWQDRLAVLSLALVVAPLAEEVVFRGYLYGVVRQLGGRWCAVTTTSLLFSAIHLHLPSMPALFLLGVTLCLIYESTRRLWVPFFLHAMFNGISATVALLWPEFVL